MLFGFYLGPRASPNPTAHDREGTGRSSATPPRCSCRRSATSSKSYAPACTTYREHLLKEGRLSPPQKAEEGAGEASRMETLAGQAVS